MHWHTYIVFVIWTALAIDWFCDNRFSSKLIDRLLIQFGYTPLKIQRDRLEETLRNARKAVKEAERANLERQGNALVSCHSKTCPGSGQHPCHDFCPMPCGYRHFVMEDHERITRCVQGHRIVDENQKCCEVIEHGRGSLIIRIGKYNLELKT